MRQSPLWALTGLLAGVLVAHAAAAQGSFDFESPSFGGRNATKLQTQKQNAKRFNPYEDEGSGEQSQEERLNDRIQRRAEREVAQQVVSGDDEDPFGGLGEFDTRQDGDVGIIEVPGVDGSTLEIEVPADTEFWDNLTSDSGS